MWCTRWYLPLLILPFSRASPLFLLAFILSLTLQARPCLYCIVLLVALAQSSCYWQPVPSQNLYASLPGSVPIDDPPLQGSVHLIDRCWCDISLTGFFQPFNVTRWEVLSLEREKSLRTGLQREKNPEAATPDAAVVEDDAQKKTEELSSGSDVSRPARVMNRIGFWWGKWYRRWQYPADGHDNETAETISSGPDESVSSPIPEPTPPPLPHLRRQYDLRPYGFELILDFGWGRSA